MSSVEDYKDQVRRLKRNIYRIIIAGLSVLVVLFGVCVGYAIWSTSQSRHNTEIILQTVEQNGDNARKETLLNRQGGDIIRCILNYPANERTQKQIDSCYPGGNQEQWLKNRDEASDANR